MVQSQTQIKMPEPSAIEGLLEDLSRVQRERFSERMGVLSNRGVEPGDAWQVAATQQRQVDLPTYEPVGDEKEAIARTTAQLEGQPKAERDRGTSPTTSPETTTATDASSSDVEGDSGGIVQDEAVFSEAVAPSEDEPQLMPPALMERSGRSRERQTDSDSDTTDTDTSERAESILDNARQFLDTAIAAELIDADADTGAIAASNRNYVLTRDSQGVVTVENHETGGRVIGDANGVKESSGLTAADQQSWLAYSQVSEEQLQQEQRQPRRQQRRQRRSELEL